MSGYKTYLVAVGIALATFAKAMAWIDQPTYEIILGLLGAGGIAFLRAGVTKSGGGV
jgi:hypothetical protein